MVHRRAKRQASTRTPPSAEGPSGPPPAPEIEEEQSRALLARLEAVELRVAVRTRLDAKAAAIAHVGARSEEVLGRQG